MKMSNLLRRKEPHISNALLIIASGFIECITFLLCFKIFASFMTGTIIIGVVEFATHNGISSTTLLRIFAIFAAFFGGALGIFYIQYQQYRKVNNSVVFTQMLSLQSFFLLALFILIVILMRCHMPYSIVAGIAVLALSFNMGFHHHHLGIRYRGMIFRTHFMTFNTWNMFNFIMKYRGLSKKERESEEGEDLFKKYRFLFFVLVLFFLSVFVAALLAKLLSLYLLGFPTFLFIAAAYCSRGKEV